MKVLLISANTERINMPVLPLGLAYVAAAADSSGHTVKTLNLMMSADTQDTLRKAIVEFNPEIIGISVRNIDDQNMQNPRFLLEAVKDVVGTCRKYSDATIVLGGAGYSIFPQAALDFLEADMGIQGEGESAFLELLERVRDKTDLAEIPGLYLPGQTRRSPSGNIKSLPTSRCPFPMFIYPFLLLSKTKGFGYLFKPGAVARWIAAIALRQRLRVASFENMILKRWWKRFQAMLRWDWIISFSSTIRSIFPFHMPTHFVSN